jgi:hypothetical protein
LLRWAFPGRIPSWKKRQRLAAANLEKKRVWTITQVFEIWRIVLIRKVAANLEASIKRYGFIIALICNIFIPLILITLWEFCLPMAQLYYQGERWWFFVTWIIEGERRRMSPTFF